MMMNAQTQAEVVPYLDAHVAAVHRGLQALMDLLIATAANCSTWRTAIVHRLARSST